MASLIQVSSVQSQTAGLAVTFSNGIIIDPSHSISGAGGLNVVGVLTSISFSGDGSGMTNIGGILPPKAISLSIII